MSTASPPGPVIELEGLHKIYDTGLNSVHALNEDEVCIGTDMLAWIARSQRVPGIKASDSVLGYLADVSPEVAVGYDAPFPDEDHMVALRQFAMLIPLRPTDEGAVRNLETWHALSRFNKPFLTIYGDNDPCTGGWDAIFQERVPGARDQPHMTLEGAKHFLGEDRPKEVVDATLDFIRRTQSRRPRD